MSSKDVGTVTGEQDRQGGFVPKLRFPEFQDAGDWQAKKLSDLLFEPKQRNRSLKYGPEHVLSVSGEFGCVNQIEFMGRSYAGASVKEYHIVEAGDIVYTKSPLKSCPNGIIKENKGETGIVSSMYAVYRPTASGNADFLDHYFSSDFKLNSYLQPLVKKGPKNSILVNNSDVLSGQIYAPEAQEQRKIADFLSSIDTLIAAEAEKLEALKDHKKGLMQQLFPAPGETTPRLRFPEFQSDADWSIQSLETLCTVLNNRRKPIASNLRVPGPYPYYGASGIVDRVNDYIFDEPLILVGEDGAKWGGFERTAFIADGRYWVNNHAHVLRPEGVIGTFLTNYLIMLDFQPFVTGKAPPKLTLGKLKAIPIPTPPTIAEQSKIGGALSSMDATIDTQASRIEELRKHKRGLMQQLFPVADQVQA